MYSQRIPFKFVKKFGDELSSIATLIVPGGRHWLVQLRKDDIRMWFDSGWNVFVEYYSIGIGCFLVFKYEGNSCFNVHVYDLKASEINYLPDGINNSHESGHDKHVKDDGFAEIMDDRKEYKNSTCGTDLKNLHQKNNGHDLQATFQSTRDKGIQFSGVEVELTSTADEGESDFLNETQKNIKKSEQETELSKLHELKSFLYRVFLIDFSHAKSLKDMNEHESLGKGEVNEVLRDMRAPRYVPRRQREVTREEKQNAFRAASMFNPDNPFCRIVLRPSYVYNGILLVSP